MADITLFSIGSNFVKACQKGSKSKIISYTLKPANKNQVFFLNPIGIFLKLPIYFWATLIDKIKN